MPFEVLKSAFGRGQTNRVTKNAGSRAGLLTVLLLAASWAAGGITDCEYEGGCPEISADPREPPPGWNDHPLSERVARLLTDQFGRIPDGVDVGVDLEWSGNSGVRKVVGADFEATASARLDRLEPTLARYVTFKALGRASFAVGFGGKVKELELDGRYLTGVQMEYSVRLPKDSYGAHLRPNPFDPATMPEGTEIVFESSRYEGTEWEAVFRNIAVETETGSWEGTALGVAKIDARRVRVLTGPVEGVQSNLLIGVKFGKVLMGVGNNTALRHYQLRTAEFEIDTEQGLQAYRRAWATGMIHGPRPGLSRVGTVQKIDFLSESSARLKVDSFVIGRVIQSNEGRRKVTRFLDSDQKIVEVAIRYNNSAMVIETELDGDVQTHRAIDIVFRNMNRDMASYLVTAFTGEQSGFPKKKRVDVRIQLTDEQAILLQGLAAENVAERRIPDGGFLAHLAEAKNSADVALRIIRYPGAGHVAEALLTLSLGNGSPLPGIITASVVSRH